MQLFITSWLPIALISIIAGCGGEQADHGRPPYIGIPDGPGGFARVYKGVNAVVTKELTLFADEELFREVMDKNFVPKDERINAINLGKAYSLSKGDVVRVIDQVIDEPSPGSYRERPGYKVEVTKGTHAGEVGWVQAAELLMQ